MIQSLEYSDYGQQELKSQIIKRGIIELHGIQAWQNFQTIPKRWHVMRILSVSHILLFYPRMAKLFTGIRLRSLSSKGNAQERDVAGDPADDKPIC
jgi:transposase